MKNGLTVASQSFLFCVIFFFFCSELCAVSKPAGRGLTTSIIVQAAKLASARALVLHSLLNNAILALEATVKADRERQLLVMQTYNLHIQAKNSKLVSNAASAGKEEVKPKKDKHAVGIDRNDPILQWSTLHQAAGLWE